MKRIHCLLSISMIYCLTTSYAQDRIQTLTVGDEVIFATVDRPGELYVVSKNGQIQRFGIDGKRLSVYKDKPAPTLFDPRDGARLFVYFRQDQHYAFLNPSFDVTASYPIDSSFVIDPWLACVSGDHNLWVIDAADKSLKKINVLSSSVDVDVKISDQHATDVSAITFMREYQGFLFLLNKEKGILIFNSMGRWLKTIERPELPYFNFLGEELYYPDADKTLLFNLFTAETRAITSKPGRFMLLTDERIFTVDGHQIDFFAAKP